MDVESQYYVILSHTIPSSEYILQGEHNLRPVKTSTEMFGGYGNIIPHSFPAVMALNHLSKSSDTVWKNLVMFHSFLCDDSETYDYAERSWKRDFEESELEFVCNSNYFYKIIDLGNRQQQRFVRQKRINAIDFDHFPVKVYPTTKESLEHEPSPSEDCMCTLTEALSKAKEQPEYETEISYTRGFQIFCDLKTNNKKLYNQIRLYVFAGNLSEFANVYRNDNAQIAFYISILESQAGDPPTCREPLHCDECGRDIFNHGTPIEKHFINKYGTIFKDLRGIRHRFFHHGEYSSVTEKLWNIYDKREDAENQMDQPDVIQLLDEEEQALDDLENEVERLKKITRITLIESFMHYYD